jgi:peroxiredoxin (alkyl hydroperoxide reductase subunit C)
MNTNNVNVLEEPSAEYKAAQGKKAPLFSAEAAAGNQTIKVELEDFKGKWVVLFFYPADFTPV